MLFLALMVGSDAPRAGTGLYERLASGVLSLWVFVVAARLLRLAREGAFGEGDAPGRPRRPADRTR
jgi:hypothetical protein